MYASKPSKTAVSQILDFQQKFFILSESHMSCSQKFQPVSAPDENDLAYTFCNESRKHVWDSSVWQRNFATPAVTWTIGTRSRVQHDISEQSRKRRVERETKLPPCFERRKNVCKQTCQCTSDRVGMCGPLRQTTTLRASIKPS